MKKLIYILFLFFTIQSAFAQDEQPGAKLREKMIEYIQAKLGLDKAEAEKFQPICLEYIKDLHRTTKEFKGDRLILQQKVVELRLRYREQFKPVIGEKRSNDVFMYEHDFVEKVKDVLLEHKQDRIERRPNKGKNTELLTN